VPKASATSFFPERPLSPSGPPTSKEPAPIEPVDLVAGGMELEGGDVLGRDGEAGLLREGAEGESVGGGDVVEGEGDGDEARSRKPSTSSRSRAWRIRSGRG
jgi:hypothetical protein